MVTHPLGRTIAIRLALLMLCVTFVSVIFDFVVSIQLHKSQLNHQIEQYINGVGPTIKESLWTFNVDMLDVVLVSITSLDGVEGGVLKGEGIEISKPEGFKLTKDSCETIISSEFKQEKTQSDDAAIGRIDVCYQTPKVTTQELFRIAYTSLLKLFDILLVLLVTLLLLRRYIVHRLQATISLLRSDVDLFKRLPKQNQIKARSDEIDVLETELANRSLRLSRAIDQISLKRKMEALGQLTGSVAHEFNNLLAVIAGGIELAIISNKQADVGKHLQWSMNAVNSAAEIAQELLSFTRAPQLLREIIEMEGLKAELIQNIIPFSKENVEIAIESTATHSITTNRAQLFGSVLNLIKNSIEAAGKEGGKVSCIISNASAEEAKLVEGPIGQDVIAFHITDNAGGVPIELRERLFTPFFTTKSAGRGTGLGLWTVYNFAKSTGGVVVYHPIENGSHFNLILPSKFLFESESLSTNAPTVQVNPIEFSVLIVDDELELLAIYAEYFKLHAKKVYAASNVVDGLQLLDTHDSIDTVICDYKLPDGEGSAIVSHALKRNPNTISIIVSGNPSLAEEELAQVNVVLHKPVKLNKVLEAVQRLHRSQQKIR